MMMNNYCKRKLFVKSLISSYVNWYHGFPYSCIIKLSIFAFFKVPRMHQIVLLIIGHRNYQL